MIMNSLKDLRESRFFIPALILLAGVAASTVLFFSTPDPETREVKPPIILVDAIQVSRAPLTMQVETQGEVIARTRTTLVSEVSGVITSISENFVAGGAFSAGDTLVTIDDRNYVADVERAKADLAGARTRLAEEEGLAQYARSDWERSNAPTEASELALRKPQIEEARANLDFARAELILKQGDLARTRVTSVYQGMVESREVDVGQYVTPGTVLGIVFSADTAEVRLPIPLHELDFLELPDGLRNNHQHVPVTFSAITRNHVSKWHGKIVRTEAVMDRRNRVLFAIAEVENPYFGFPEPLRVGSYVRATITGKHFASIVRIPRAAVRPGNNIWIVNADNKLERRTVHPVRADENFLYIESEVNDGEIVSVTPLENPLPGTEVSFKLQSPVATNE